MAKVPDLSMYGAEFAMTSVDGATRVLIRPTQSRWRKDLDTRLRARGWFKWSPAHAGFVATRSIMFGDLRALFPNVGLIDGVAATIQGAKNPPTADGDSATETPERESALSEPDNPTTELDALSTPTVTPANPDTLPIGVKSILGWAIGQLNEAQAALAGVERARGRGHILALEWEDQRERIQKARDKLGEVRELGRKNGEIASVEAYIESLGGEPDLDRYRVTPDASTPRDESGPSPRPVTPQVPTAGQLASFIAVAADSVGALRRMDVERVLREAPAIFRDALAGHIKESRADLVGEVDDVMAEFRAPAPATDVPAQPAQAPGEAPEMPAANLLTAAATVRAEAKGVQPGLAKTFNTLADAIESRNVAALNNILGSMDNKRSRELFVRATGVTLPRTVGGTREAINAWLTGQPGDVVLQFGQAMRDAGLELPGLDVRKWSKDLGSGREVHARLLLGDSQVQVDRFEGGKVVESWDGPMGAEVTRKVREFLGSITTTGTRRSPQFELYAAALRKHQGSLGMFEQVYMDPRLEDGEDRLLLALAEQHGDRFDEIHARIGIEEGRAALKAMPLDARMRLVLGFGEGDRVRFTSTVFSDSPPLEGVAVNIDPTSGSAWRVRIRSDVDAPQGGGKLEWLTYSNAGTFDRVDVDLSPVRQFERLRADSRGLGGAIESACRAFGPVGELSGIFWQRWAAAPGLVEAVRDGSGQEVVDLMADSLLREPWEQRLPATMAAIREAQLSDTASMAVPVPLLDLKDRNAVIRAQVPGSRGQGAAYLHLLAVKEKFDRAFGEADVFAHSEEQRILDVERAVGESDRVSAARNALYAMRQAMSERNAALEAAVENARLLAEPEAHWWGLDVDVLSRAPSARATAGNGWTKSTWRDGDVYTNGHIVDLKGAPHLKGWEKHPWQKSPVKAEDISRVVPSDSPRMATPIGYYAAGGNPAAGIYPVVYFEVPGSDEVFGVADRYYRYMRSRHGAKTTFGWHGEGKPLTVWTSPAGELVGVVQQVSIREPMSAANIRAMVASADALRARLAHAPAGPSLDRAVPEVATPAAEVPPAEPAVVVQAPEQAPAPAPAPLEEKPGDAPAEESAPASGSEAATDIDDLASVRGRKRSDILGDFGQRIGGARKDLYMREGINLAEWTGLEETERAKFAEKPYVWPPVDRATMVANGADPLVAYAVEVLQRSIPLRPATLVTSWESGRRRKDWRPSAEPGAMERYVRVVGNLREAIKSVRSQEDLVAAVQSIPKWDWDWLSRCGNANRKRFGLVENAFRFSCDGSYFIRALTREMEREERLARLRQEEKAARAAAAGTGQSSEEREELEKVVHANITHALNKNANGKSPYAYWISRDDRLTVDLAPSWGPHSAAPVATMAVKFLRAVRSRSVEIEQCPFNGTILAEDAERYLRTAAESLCSGLGGDAGAKKDRAIIEADESVARNLVGCVRTGPAWRDGNITPERFMETFAFRAGEFGNWVNGAERQGALNAAFDGLMDMASVFGLQPKQLGLNGTMAIAFGARGRGGRAAAHYECGRRVINLTRTQGAGSLAHEMGHAIDHFVREALYRPETSALDPFATSHMTKLIDESRKALCLDFGTSPTTALIRTCVATRLWWTEADSVEQLDADCVKALDKARTHPLWEFYARALDRVLPGGERILERPSEARQAILEAVARQGAGAWNWGPLAMYARGLQAIGAAMDPWMTKQGSNFTAARHHSVRTSTYLEDAGWLDQGRKTYYTQPTELFARAVERVVALRLQEKGWRSDYLVEPYSDRTMLVAGRSVSRFPEGAELYRIADVMQAEVPLALQYAEEATRPQAADEDVPPMAACG